MKKEKTSLKSMKKFFISVVLATSVLLTCILPACKDTHVHVLIKVEAVEKTHDTDGNEEYYVCECGKLFADENATVVLQVIPTLPKGHTLTKTDEVAPTCMQEGTQAYYTCTCGMMFSDETATVVITEPTPIAKRHNVTLIPKVEPSCDMKGAEAHYRCVNCGNRYQDEQAQTTISQPQPIDALSHDYSAGACLHCGYPTPSENLEYVKTSNTTCRLKSIGNCRDTEIVVPTSVNKLIVTEIAGAAFSGNTTITKVTLPDTVTKMGGSVFLNCTALTDVKLPKNVSGIEADFFSGCTSLVNVTLPETVKTVGSRIFKGCESLTEIVLPETVTKLSDEIFSGCRQLKRVVFSEKVKEIPQYAFYDCFALEEVDFPDGLTAIYDHAFGYCKTLKKIELPKGLKTIGISAFGSCYALTEIALPDSVQMIGRNAFAQCQAVTSISIGKNLTDVGQYAFRDLVNLQTLYYNAIECEFWLGEANLTNGVFERVGINGDGVRVTIGKSVKTIPDSFLSPDDSGGGSMYVPKIISVEFEEGCACTKIENHAFLRLNLLQEIRLPNTVETIGKGAFMDCVALTGLRLPNSIKSLGEGLLQGCTALEYLVIPNQSITFGNSIFYQNAKFSAIYFGGTQAEWNTFAIGGYNNSDVLRADKRTVYFYSEEEPTTAGNYWHYVNDEPTMWTQK